jgi:hypothetical protein
MGLQITSRKSGNVTILDLVGRIIIGSSNAEDAESLAAVPSI